MLSGALHSRWILSARWATAVFASLFKKCDIGSLTWITWESQKLLCLEGCGLAELMMMYSVFLYYPRCPTTAASLGDHVVVRPTCSIHFEMYSSVWRCTLIENSQLSMTVELQAGIFVEVLNVTLPKPVGCTDKKEVWKRKSFSQWQQHTRKKKLECSQKKSRFMWQTS